LTSGSLGFDIIDQIVPAGISYSASGVKNTEIRWLVMVWVEQHLPHQYSIPYQLDKDCGGYQ
jgi:hypothetical protein